MSKSIALLVWNADKEDDAHVYVGKIVRDEGGYQFVNESKGWRVRLDDEKMSRLTAVTADTKEIFLGADYFISLTIAALPNDSADGLDPTGMKWP